MTFQPVPTASIVTMLCAVIIAFGLPIALLIVLRMKTHARILPFFLGCISFTLFAMVLEQQLHAYVLGSETLAPYMQNIWIYALYGGFCAALFEETGRYIFMWLSLRKGSEPQNALMYGAGHGGIEAILLVGLAYISNLSVCFMINAGQGEQIMAGLASLDDATKAATLSGIESLSTTAPYLFLVGGIERVMAVTLHIALSVIIYTAVTKKKFGYALLAFALHMLVDTLTLIINSYTSSILVTELAVLVMVVLIGLYALKLYKTAKASQSLAAVPAGEPSEEARPE